MSRYSLFVIGLLFSFNAMAADGILLEDFEATKLNVACRSNGAFSSLLRVKLANGVDKHFSSAQLTLRGGFAPDSCADAMLLIYGQALSIQAAGCGYINLVVHDIPDALARQKLLLENLEVVPAARCSGDKRFM